MSSAPPNITLITTFSLILSVGLSVAPLSIATETPIEFADGLHSAPHAPASHKTVSPDTFFANLVRTGQDIEYLASRKHYQELLTAAGQLCHFLEQANTILPENDQQRAARFIATSRSLSQLCQAIHSFMWKGTSDELYATTEKLERLVAHMRALITPEELAQAQAELKGANG